jgi:fibronectin-binding autotransporter adhesin
VLQYVLMLSAVALCKERNRLEKRFCLQLFTLICTTLLAVTAAGQDCTPPPTANNGGPYCEGATISLTATPENADAYFWTGPNAFISILQNPTIANASSSNEGTYSVTVTANGCISNPNTTVAVNFNPPSTITAPTWVTTSSGNTASGPSGVATYSWSIANGTITNGQTAQAVTFTAGSTGTLTLTLTTTSLSGCSSTSSRVVRVDPQPTITVDNVSAQTGAKGTTKPFNFYISLSNPSTQTVSVEYYTSNQTALAGKDYQYTTGTAIFVPGETGKTAPVNVLGTNSNPQKLFLLNLYEPENATIKQVNGYKVRGQGTILAK